MVGGACYHHAALQPGKGSQGARQGDPTGSVDLGFGRARIEVAGEAARGDVGDRQAGKLLLEPSPRRYREYIQAFLEPTRHDHAVFDELPKRWRDDDAPLVVHRIRKFAEWHSPPVPHLELARRLGSKRIHARHTTFSLRGSLTHFPTLSHKPPPSPTEKLVFGCCLPLLLYLNDLLAGEKMRAELSVKFSKT